MKTPADSVVSLPRRLPKYGEAHVPAGEYEAVLAGYETWSRFKGWPPRVVMVWRLVEPAGVVIPGYYRVTKLHGGPRRNGRFEIGRKSRLYRDLARMLNTNPPTDRIPLDEIHGVYSIVVRDVTQDSENRPLATAVYSVVDWVRGRS